MKEQKIKKVKERPAKKQGKHIHSIKSSVVGLVLFSIVVSVVALLLIVIPVANNALSGMTESYMRDVCDTCGFNIDAAISRSGNTILNTEYLGNLVSDVQINNLDSSYAYVVGADGNIIYHPDTEKVNQPVESEKIMQICEQMSNGENVTNKVISDNGNQSYAAYYVTSNKAALLVITTDKGDILSSSTTILIRSVIGAIAIFIILGIFSYLMASKMINPILQITKVVNRFSALDFKESATAAKISKKNDETGEMARAIAALRERLVEIVSQIKTQSELLYGASSELDTNANQTTSTVGNVEVAVNEIATGATSQASETQKATDDIINMGDMIQYTNTQVESLTNTATLMRRSSDEAASTLKELDDINKRAIASIDVIYEQTNTTNASAMKIKEATNLISSIAEETNLLSLNASIEAARAGEAGRGFAVVASQIQKLAEQSNNSTNQIDQIIHALIEDSEKAVETMDEVKTIMNQQSQNVQRTGLVFEQVRDGIGHSINGVGEIASRTNQLDSARAGVVDVVQNLTAIAEQNAASTQQTSASVMEVSNIMQEITENANRLKEIASVLEESMNKFTL